MAINLDIYKFYTLGWWSEKPFRSYSVWEGVGTKKLCGMPSGWSQYHCHAWEKLQISAYFVVVPSITQRLTVQSKCAVSVMTNISVWTNPLSYFKGKKRLLKLLLLVCLYSKLSAIKLKTESYGRKKQQTSTEYEISTMQLPVVYYFFYSFSTRLHWLHHWGWEEVTKHYQPIGFFFSENFNDVLECCCSLK